MRQQRAHEKIVDLPQLLREFVRAAKPQGAWLGIIRGANLEVSTAWHGPGLEGRSFAVEGNAVLQRMQRTRQHVVCARGRVGWADVPHAVPKTSSYWACFPLICDHRSLGSVGVWGEHKPRAAEAKRLQQMAGQLAPDFEVIATLRGLATELQDLAGSKRPAGGTSGFSDLPRTAEIVLRCVVSRLSVQAVSLFAPDAERHLVYEFRLVGGRFSSVTTPLAGNFVGAVPGGRAPKDRGLLPRSTSRAHRGQFPQTIPLSSHGKTIGALVFWGRGKIVAPHLAQGLRAVISRPLAAAIENSRRHADPQLRSGRLELIRDLSPQVIGLTDPRQAAQVAASRISQHFGHEATRLVLIDRRTADLVTATAGGGAPQAPGMSSFILTDPENAIASEVLRTGRSVLVRGSTLGDEPRGKAGRGRESSVCVALNQGGHVLGILELRSPRRNAFTADDLLDLECAAAIVAAVISAAGRSPSAENSGAPFGSGTAPAETRLTSQRLPENRLVQAAKLMSVGEMAAGIAHELNNPLTTVAGFAELLLDEIAPDAPFRADVEMVMQEAQRARGVVRRLLDFARQGEGVRSRADIGEILEDVLALTTHFIHTSGVKLDIGLAKDMPWVLVDSNQMKQVFLNLIHNALQAMPAGGSLQVRTEVSQSDDRQWVVVRIADNGLGIRPGDIARIFEPFFTTRAQHGGTGLGLSVSYGIVADHGGKIEVESRPGVGSTFSVWLPA